MPHVMIDGHRIHYRERGRGPLLLLLHGNTASSVYHAGEIDHFGSRYRVVAPDLLGTGGSDRVAIWADDWWAQGARHAAALMELLGESQCLVMGTSGGAVAALWMAILYPDRVRAVIADSVGERMVLERIRQEIVSRAQRTPGQVAFWSGAHGEDWEQVVDADSALLLRAAERGGDWWDGRLSEVRCPVLLTVSRADDLLPDVVEQAQRIASQVPNITLHVGDEGTHPYIWSQAEAFRAVANEFLDGLTDG